SGASIHRALQAAFGAHGLDCPPPSISRKVIGLSLVEAMAVLAPEADHEMLSRSYKEAFFAMRQDGGVEEPLFDGILALLDGLDVEGWVVAGGGGGGWPPASRTAGSGIAGRAMAPTPALFRCRPPTGPRASRIRQW